MHRVAPALALLPLLLLGPGCSGDDEAEKPPEPPGPLVVIALDGTDLRVVQDLWTKGELAGLKGLADRGSFGNLKTGYQARSAIVWATVATGFQPAVHGIEDFTTTVETNGVSRQVPVDSTTRRTKALWNIASEMGKKVLLLGWWASWPAEEVNGLVVTDRIQGELTSGRVWPSTLEPQLVTWIQEAEASKYGQLFPGETYVAPQDRLVSHVATRSLPEGHYDLSMIYLRRTDVVSHRFYKYFEPDKYEPFDAEAEKQQQDLFWGAYRAVDTSVADIVAAAPPNARFLVLSDHGFAAAPEKTRVKLRMTRVLQHLGYWEGKGTTPDPDKTRVVAPLDQSEDQTKTLKFRVKGTEGGIVPKKDVPKLARELKNKLSKVTYKSSGHPVFEVELAKDNPDADLLVHIQRGPWIDDAILYEGEEIKGGIRNAYINTGFHNDEPPGLIIMAGEGIRQGAAIPEGASIHDIAPTVLYMLGLPYGEDMAGKPLLGLFTDEWVAAHPPTSKPTWESQVPNAARERKVDALDEEVMKELEALGYFEEQ